ncbi:phormicin-like [Musca vetustissima]|uniref:phormicin-like n=1 Tax=Musca vetustissima TaxID=27455 RepID=UPI002AB7BBC0|nr:phormicin-like [Musca vetustissima]
MKYFIVFAVFFVSACFIGQSSASPASNDGGEANFVHGADALKELEPELHGRYKRATCDLLSGTGVNHSACAAHCLLRGNRGGYCNGKGVCVCRK